jgi:hypothetical protein
MRPSIFDRMDPKVREEINRRRLDRGQTIEELFDYLESIGVRVSTAAIGRHVKKLEDQVGSKIRELRIAAEAVRKTLDDGDDAKVGALNRELAHSILMRLQTAQDEEGNDVQFSPMEAMFLAKALDHLASAEKKDADRILKIRKETAEKAVTEVGKLAKAEGWSPETVARVREHILKVA